MSDETYEISIDFRQRKLGSKHYLVGRNRAIELSGSGAYFVEKMLDGETVDSIVEKAAEDFSVDPETIRTDLVAFAESLRAADVLE